MAVTALLLAVLRPVRIAAREGVVGARVVVLADSSGRSMALPGDHGGTRLGERDEAIHALEKSSARHAPPASSGSARARRVPSPCGTTRASPAPPSMTRARCGAISPQRSAPSPARRTSAPRRWSWSATGRLDDPSESASEESLRELGAELHVPIHTVATSRSSPPDASVRRVAAAGAAVAHVPMPLRVRRSVAAAGLSCDAQSLPSRPASSATTAPRALLASGLAHPEGWEGHRRSHRDHGSGGGHGSSRWPSLRRPATRSRRTIAAS